MLELDLELVQQETPVGSFRLDVLAREKGHGGRNVAIENQLGWTDHNHLGQLLTYAAGCEAGVVVWIAREFVDEHRAAIDWLNRCTSDEFEFFAVEIHAVRIGDSIPAPEFRVKAFPNGWPKEKRQEASVPSPFAEQYGEFFQPLIDDLHEMGFTDRIEAEPRSWQEFPSEVSDNITCGVCLDEWWSNAEEEKGKAWVYVWFYRSRVFINQVFEALKEEREEIESSLDANWDWWRIDRRWNIAAVRIEMDCSIDDPPEKHEETRAWMLENLPKFKEILNPRLEQILAELQ